MGGKSPAHVDVRVPVIATGRRANGDKIGVDFIWLDPDVGSYKPEPPNGGNHPRNPKPLDAQRPRDRVIRWQRHNAASPVRFPHQTSPHWCKLLTNIGIDAVWASFADGCNDFCNRKCVDAEFDGRNDSFLPTSTAPAGTGQ